VSEEPKAIVLRWLNDGLSAGNFAVIDELFAPDYVNHSPRLGDVGREYTAKDTAAFAKAFPDWQTTIDDVISEGEKVVVRRTVQGTYTGKAEGAAVLPTGKLVTFTIWETFRVSSGKIVERWAIHDFQQQISET
jgi:predicted ester cyclase